MDGAPMQNRKLLLLVLAALCAAAVTVAVRFIGSDAERQVPASLEGALAGIERLAGEFPAPGDEPLALPADHASKPGQFAESWLFAGLLRDDAGGTWGFQLAFQRVAVQAGPASRDSAWAARAIWRARLSIEPAAAAAVAEERLSRAALGLAGATQSPAAVWLEDWRFDADESGDRFRLQAATGTAGLNFSLVPPQRAPVPIERTPYRGYWWPDLEVGGTLVWQGRALQVSGRAMLERLWGRGLPAGRGQLALASLWLDSGDGIYFRCEQLRRRAGDGSPLTECSADPPTSADALTLAPDDGGWQALGGIRYPLRWRVQLGADAVPLVVNPLSAAGAVSLDGAWSGIVIPPGDGKGWGLLQLSNFAAP
jgi:predicted secreted hydrolase